MLTRNVVAGRKRGHFCPVLGLTEGVFCIDQSSSSLTSSIAECELFSLTRRWSQLRSPYRAFRITLKNAVQNWLLKGLVIEHPRQFSVGGAGTTPMDAAWDVIFGQSQRCNDLADGLTEVQECLQLSASATL